MVVEGTAEAVKKVVNWGTLELQAGAVMESELTTKSVDAKVVKDISYYDVTLVIWTGTNNLAPESLPTTVKVVYKVVVEPNKVFKVVAVIFTVVPITVLDTFVPIVVVGVFKEVAAVVFIPTPLNAEVVLTSPIVTEYPDCSNVLVAPK